ncbi:MAG: hypothetical protein HC840_13285 [Leptolyngbyaceae cyanobacterium RM2_2_4]|nr:hypothetical protein [Leptolyngbyaceae cyanobacterium SM1_4_3]NJN91182.1 hypothetical protein [Leptolyngbyaceae cyanobacterium SL_5_14]NJO50242.1 hypothetical protein [Leptolyngbyaceae cyanobacterium RM2_2_4]
MSTVLSQPDWWEAWDESRQNGEISCRSDGFDTLKQGCLANLCRVYERWVDLRAGLSLYIYKYEPFTDLILNETGHHHSHFALSFFVLGNVKTILHSVTSDVYKEARNNYLIPILCEAA